MPTRFPLSTDYDELIDSIEADDEEGLSLFNMLTGEEGQGIAGRVKEREALERVGGVGATAVERQQRLASMPQGQYPTSEGMTIGPQPIGDEYRRLPSTIARIPEKVFTGQYLQQGVPGEVASGLTMGATEDIASKGPLGTLGYYASSLVPGTAASQDIGQRLASMPGAIYHGVKHM